MRPHQKQWDFLKKTAAAGRIPHAYLFYGQDLSGMKQTALEFVKLINHWKNLPQTHPDLIIVQPEEQREIKIKQIRQLYLELSLKAYSAPWKSVIIEKAHTLNREAQSAFLKLLEEPKGQTLFILITNWPDFLLPTILSRVERLRFQISPPSLTEAQNKIISEMLKLKKGDLGARFEYAKKLAENPQELKETLEVWLRYFRENLLQNPDQPRLLSLVKNIQNIHFLLSTTNVNPRLALEIIMLEL